MSELEDVDRKFGPQPMSRREDIQWLLYQQMFLGLGAGKESAAETLKPNPSGRALAGNMKTPPAKVAKEHAHKAKSMLFRASSQ